MISPIENFVCEPIGKPFDDPILPTRRAPPGQISLELMGQLVGQNANVIAPRVSSKRDFMHENIAVGRNCRRRDDALPCGKSNILLPDCLRLPLASQHFLATPVFFELRR